MNNVQTTVLRVISGANPNLSPTPSPPANTATPTSSGSSSSVPIGAIVGGIAGGVAAIIAAAVLTYCCLTRRRKSQYDAEAARKQALNSDGASSDQSSENKARGLSYSHLLSSLSSLASL